MEVWARLGLLFAIACGVWASRFSAASPPAETRWQYQIQSVNDATWEADMNAQGQAGWELVFARRANDGAGGPMNYECIFKRPLRPSTP